MSTSGLTTPPTLLGERYCPMETLKPPTLPRPQIWRDDCPLWWRCGGGYSHHLGCPCKERPTFSFSPTTPTPYPSCRNMQSPVGADPTTVSPCPVHPPVSAGTATVTAAVKDVSVTELDATSGGSDSNLDRDMLLGFSGTCADDVLLVELAFEGAWGAPSQGRSRRQPRRPATSR